jgi:flagellar hook-associated protein 1 FlgK
MSGLSALLETARRALMSQQGGISVTSHNIANASTPGYSRQRINITTTLPSKEIYGYLGTGVTVASVDQVRDSFLDQQVRYSNAAVGDATSQQGILGQVEAAFNEPSTSGLSSSMTAFFNSFQDLSTHPEDPSSRNAVIQQGNLMSQTFHRLHDNLAELDQSLQEDVQTKISTINQLASQISDLDTRITSATANGGAPNDLMDQRNQKIEDLSKLVNVTVASDNSGSVMVSVNGMVIASRAGGVQLKAVQSGNQLMIQTVKDNVPVNITGGELGGTLKQYNVSIPKYLSQLDQLAGALISRVNTLHRAGYNLMNPPTTGNNFFTGSTAADINVDPAVAANASLVAASGTGASGDNSVALAISKVPQDLVMNGGTQTLGQYYNGVSSSVGSEIDGANSTVTSQNLILDQLENQRSAVSGVSLDEEMTHLIQFQRAYEAAARLVNTTNEMFTTVIGMMQ